MKEKCLADLVPPIYGCPICRRAVEGVPTKVIAMMNQCEFFADFNGEAIPAQPGPNADNIWMLFFPPRT